MSVLCIDLPPVAPDYSGAASALFDLGGIVVMHDASGCTGNYTGFDEPRWFGSRSAVYCSGLRRMDAILGNDKKFIDGALMAAKDLNPTMISYLGSPVPMVIGIDLEGMAAETEVASGIPCFGFNTTGQHYYDRGASDVFLKLLRYFAEPIEGIKTNRQGKRFVNVLGLLSIDMGSEKNAEEICACIEEAGFSINASFAMGLTLEQVRRAANADINIVTARCGLDAAEYMKKRYGIPYICTVPVGGGSLFRKKLAGESPVIQPPEGKRGILIIHEQIFANSLRELAASFSDIPVTVGSMYGLDTRIAMEHDLDLPTEKSVREAINSGRYSVILADPEIGGILKRENVTFVELPHVALSGRLYLDRYPSYLGESMETMIRNAVLAAQERQQG